MLTILGSGTCVPSLTRNSCSFLLQTGGQNLLFDCGSGVMRRLLEIGVTIYDISHIFISHFHPDHIGELASFFFALKYSPQPDPRPAILEFRDQLAERGIELIAIPTGCQALLAPGDEGRPTTAVPAIPRVLVNNSRRLNRLDTQQSP